ncbi:MAG: MFS transporter, partial [Tannerellaceae bacterium]
FSKRDKSLANSMQSMGSFAGTMIGSGLLLLLFKQFGWERILPFLAVFVLVALIPLYFYRGKGIDTGAMKQKAKKADVLLFFTQKGIGKQILFLFFFYSGLIGILAMLKPFMVDLGYDMKKIGVMSGIVGTSIGFICSFAGGFILRKLGLYKTRITFAGLILMTCAYFYTISLYTPSTIQLYIGIFLLWGSYGMATIVVYTSAMLKVRPGREGTDFTIQTVITHLSGMFMAIIGGRIADHFGYNGLFLIETFIAMISLVYVTVVMKESKQEETSDIESTNCTSIEAIQE